MSIAMVVAASSNDVIGRDNDLPWHLPGDLREFARRTRGHAVILGRRTAESIQNRLGGPLPNRLSVVVSRHPAPADAGNDSRQVQYVTSIDDALAVAQKYRREHHQAELFVIGGTQVFTELLPAVNDIYLTRVHTTVAGDAYLPEGWLNGFVDVSNTAVTDEQASHPYSYLHYQRRPR